MVPVIYGIPEWNGGGGGGGGGGGIRGGGRVVVSIENHSLNRYTEEHNTRPFQQGTFKEKLLWITDTENLS